MTKVKQPSVERVRAQLYYCPSTGNMYWRHDSWAGFKKSVLVHRAGGLAGCTRKDGRRVINFDGRVYLAYRLAWVCAHGDWPAKTIDHINGDCTDDRLCNLRDVSQLINGQNIRLAQRTKRTSKLLGVYSNPRNPVSPWRSLISTKGRTRYLGVFKTELDAHDAYVQAKRLLHEGNTL